MLIGVFDSGRGGHFVAARLRTLLPEHTFEVIDDHEHVPYGDRSVEEIIALTDAALQPLIAKTRVIVIACNTATAVAIDFLRASYPNHQFIGYEPMVKPLCNMTKNGVILATRATLRSNRYAALKQDFISHVIAEPDTTNWAFYIENGRQDEISYNELDEIINSGANVIALSCTHYLALEDSLKARYEGRATVIEPTAAIANRIQTVITMLQPQ